MENNDNDFFAIYETLRDKAFEWSENTELYTLAHLYKSKEITIDELLYLFNGSLFRQAMELALELECKFRTHRGEWERPKLMAEKEHAYRYEDGLWYAKSQHDSVCPSCGEYPLVYWNGPDAYECCDNCRVAWKLCWKGLWPVPEEFQREISVDELHNKVNSYRDGQAMYNTSTVTNVQLDCRVREKMEEINHYRKLRTKENPSPKKEDQWELNF